MPVKGYLIVIFLFTCQTALVRPHCVAALLRNITFTEVNIYDI